MWYITLTGRATGALSQLASYEPPRATLAPVFTSPSSRSKGEARHLHRMQHQGTPSAHQTLEDFGPTMHPDTTSNRLVFRSVTMSYQPTWTLKTPLIGGCYLSSQQTTISHRSAPMASSASQRRTALLQWPCCQTNRFSN